MAFRVRAIFIYERVPAGAGSALLGQLQADQPGYGATAGPGEVGSGQTYSDIVGELVPGGDSPSSANFQTALEALAADELTRLNTAGSSPGFTSGTPLALIQAWSTGGP